MSAVSRRQVLKTLGVGLGLSGFCHLYALLLNPLLVPARDHVPLPTEDPWQSASPTKLAAPRLFTEIAEKHLSLHQWAAEATVLFGNSEVFVYSREMRPLENDQEVELRPFALVWFSEGRTSERGPISVVCEKAKVRFSSKIDDIIESQPGRPVQAQLEGGVRIEGPDGLMVEGQSFVFDEKPMHVFCDHPVRFQYRQNHGTANKLQIELLADEKLRRENKFAVTGVKSFMLRSKVKMDLVSEDEDEPQHVKIQSTGPFEYVLADQTASFEDEVWVYRQTGPEEFDSLHCDLLWLFFEQQAKAPGAPSEGFQGLGGPLSLRGLRGEGNNVALKSPENRLDVSRFQTLEYDVQKKHIALVSDGLLEAIVQSTRLECPSIQLVHGDDSRMQTASCQGPGHLHHYDKDSGQPILSAIWQKELRKATDDASGLDTIELDQEAIVQQYGQEGALKADVIKLWYVERPESDAERIVGSSRFQPVQVVAQNSVILRSPEMQAQTQELKIRFESGHDAPTARSNSGSQVEATANDQAKPQDALRSAQPEAEPIKVSADQIQVLVTQQGAGAVDKFQVDEIATHGHVEVAQQSGGEEALQISADSLWLRNQPGAGQVLQVNGEPVAQIRNGRFAIEARNIQFDRAQNVARVENAGLLTMPVDSTLEGEKLPEPQLLSIWWKERMAFDGRTAEFFGNVETKLNDSSLLCQQMRVELTERISFADGADAQRSKVDVRNVVCQDGVNILSNQYEGGNVAEVHRGSFYELRVNQETGETSVQGPGKMTIWRRALGTRTPLANANSGRANQPLELEQTEWEYICVEFDGAGEGNLKDQSQSFYDGVEIVYGGVAHVQEKIDRDKLPNNAAWLQSESLTVWQHDQTADKDAYFELVANDNARMEGRTKDGIFQAQADQISYDESLDKFTVLSRKSQYASIWRQKTLGGEAQTYTGRRIEFIPTLNDVKARDVTGFQGQ